MKKTDLNNALEGLAEQIVSQMPQAEREKMHRVMAKRLIGDFVEMLHKNDALFGMTGRVEAGIVVGDEKGEDALTYWVNVEAKRSTEAEKDKFRSDVIRQKDPSYSEEEEFAKEFEN